MEELCTIHLLKYIEPQYIGSAVLTIDLPLFRFTSNAQAFSYAPQLQLNMMTAILILSAP